MLSPLLGIDRLRAAGKRPLIPAGFRIYAVGDIHGRLDLLSQLLTWIAQDIADRPVVRPICIFLGDYIDRGACSRQTIDRLIEFGEAHESVFLKGNHEYFAVKCLSDRGLFDQWMRLGGIETLISYGIPRASLQTSKSIGELQAVFHQSLPQAHFRFFRNLENSFALGDFFFAHAGVNPDIELSLQIDKDLLWIRDDFLSSEQDFGKVVIHGHTPTLEVEVKHNRINIDTGAFATGRLTCLIIEDWSLSIVDTR